MANFKVLIADDSALYRRILATAVALAAPGAIIDLVNDGVEVMEILSKNSYDLVLIDVNMPNKNGLETLSEIKPMYPNLPVVVISGVASKSAELTIEALELGALDFIPKPQSGSFDENMDHIVRPLKALMQQINDHSVRSNAISSRPTYRTGRAVRTQQPLVPVSPRVSRTPTVVTNATPNISSRKGDAESIDGVDLVLIAASTGGPAALEKVVCRLSATFNKPILIVQHMPAGFTKALADKMNNRGSIRVTEAVSGSPLRPGQALLAPGGYHMVLDHNNLIRLEQTDYVNGVRPSADVLFKSVAQEFRGNRVLCVVLTGMGTDATKGVGALKKSCKCYCITQNESSCVVYGMPRSLVISNLSDETLALDRISQRIEYITRRGTV